MDLSVLHVVDSPERDYTWKDRLNSLTGRLDCRLLEWTGWYNQDIYQRLLGHYRLYQIFRQENDQAGNIEEISAFIVHYRSSHSLKYVLSQLTSVLYYLVSLGKVYYPFCIEGLNKILINEHPDILHEFLSSADENFKQTLKNTADKITSPGFCSKSAQEIHLPVLIHYKNEFNIAPAPNNQTKGKEKGVFSKKQLLIFFDLLAESKSIEKIDYSKPNKFESIAEMLQALSGKGKDSFIEQLKDSRNNGLYEFHNKGELNQLIVILTNLSAIFSKAGFHSITKIVNKKLRELDSIKKNQYLDNS